MDDYRSEFFDTIQELCDIAEGPTLFDQAVWKAEYLTRSGHWYHYYGIVRGGKAASIGHDYDCRTGISHDADAHTFLFTLLDFATNDAIASYCGGRYAATDILEEVETSGLQSSEVLRIGVEVRERLACGRAVMTVTDFAFVGLLQNRREDVKPRCLSSREQVSPKWCRGRRFIGSAPQFVGNG